MKGGEGMLSAEEQWSRWHAQRERDFGAELGWLTLVSYEWVGSESDALEEFPGVWSASDDAVTATFARIDGVERGEEPVVGDVVIELDDEGSDMTLRKGTRHAEVVRRDGDYAVRVRDEQAQTLREYEGIDTFDYDPDFVMSGVIVVVEPAVVSRGTARQDLQTKARVVAELHLELPEEKSTEADSVVLAVEGDLAGELVVIFHDDTNGRESADWRYAALRSPWEGEGEPAVGEARDAEIDFNYSLNFPAAYTPFGTCPRPLAGNRIPLAIEAGERRPT